MVRAAAAPLPLVQGTDGTYVVCEEGRAFLERLDSEVTLAVVAIAGRYRSGKSFLLNRGLLDAPLKKGFPTGNTVNACTRGVWIYPMPLSANDNRCFLVLDTEGTASLEANAEQDARLIGIALAVASVFIFNATGSLDETSLGDLATLTTVAQGISAVTDKWQPPELIWVLRDFALQLQGDEGKEMSPAEYLERALSEERYGKSGARAALKGFFQKRTLFPMVRPCIDEANLQKLNGLASSAFRPEFQRQLEGFRSLIRTAAVRPKELGGIALNGLALSKLVQAAVQSVNEGRAPSIQTAFDFLQERRLRDFEAEISADLDRRHTEAVATLPVRSLPGLELPPPPAGAEHFPEVWRLCEERLAQKRAALSKRLADANDEARGQLLKAALDAAQKGEGSFANSLERLGALGRAELLDAVLRLHKLCLAAEEQRRSKAEERLQALEGEVQQAHEELSKLRSEMEGLLVVPVPQGPMLHEDFERLLAETRDDAQTEMHALSERRDALSQEVCALLARTQQLEAEAEAASSRFSVEVGTLRGALEEAEAQGERLQQSAAERSLGLDEAAKRSLEGVKAGFEAIVRSCEERAAAAHGERELAERRSEAAEASLAQERERLAAEQALLAEEKEKLRRSSEDTRRQQTQELLERRQQLNEVYAGIVQDAQRCREAALSADRKLMMTEVEKESLKRRVDALSVDSQELAKTRRLYDDVRFKHASAEASVEASQKLQELQRAQLLRLETELHEVRAAVRQRELEQTHRVATMELQLQAHGIRLL
jgi:hypothetical protein